MILWKISTVISIKHRILATFNILGTENCSTDPFKNSPSKVLLGPVFNSLFCMYKNSKSAHTCIYKTWNMNTNGNYINIWKNNTYYIFKFYCKSRATDFLCSWLLVHSVNVVIWELTTFYDLCGPFSETGHFLTRTKSVAQPE
jgi:hypothetical protein